MTQTRLVEDIKNGDEKAFRQLISDHQDMVINTCYGMLQNREDAEDVAQEVFVKVYESIGSFRNESKLSTWIYRIAVNLSLNTIRKNRFKNLWTKLEEAFSDTASNGVQKENGHEFRPHRKMESNEGITLIRKAIKNLPKNQHIALTLHKYEEKSYKEIAEIMETSVSSVESLIFRAKKNLRKKLAHYYERND